MDIYEKFGVGKSAKKFNFPENYSHIDPKIQLAPVAGLEVLTVLTPELKEEYIQLACTVTRATQIDDFLAEAGVLAYVISQAPEDLWDAETYRVDLMERAYVYSLASMQRYSLWHKIKLQIDDFITDVAVVAGYRVVAVKPRG